ncbi:MAG TPA: DnaD domain protein, partial [Candidatus Aphodomonas merdavium]|nr:DnaD domain protein [Candidatus Aphodomonas merdavium]
QVENAFGYWERVGLVRRVSDNPPAYAYVNLKQLELNRAQDDDGLYRYADFNNSLQALFGPDRLLHPQDFQIVYGWIEDLRLPEEVVLMLVSSLIRSRGKRFVFNKADAVARAWADAGVRTEAEAEEMLRRSSERGDAIRQVYRKLGKRHAISQPDEALYDKWTKEWGFTQKTILAACDETTKGVPTFAYLNGILERMRAQGIRDEEGLREDAAMDAAVKEMLREAGMRSVSPNADSRSMLESFLAEGFSREAIVLAAQRVARKGGKLDALRRTLDIWKEAGAMDAQSAHAYLQRVDERRETKSTAERKVNAQQYTQREYTREELDKLFEVL